MSSPISPHTDKSTVLALAIQDKLELNKGELGIKAVLFGNHNMVKEGPSIVLFSGKKRRSLAGVSAPGGRVMNELMVLIDVLHADVKSGEAEARLFLEELAESIETVIHSDTTMGGIIIHGFVTDWDPGNTFINRSQWRTVRMTYVGTSKTYLSA